MQTIRQPNSERNKARRYSRVRIPRPFGCSLSSVGARRWFREPVRDIGLVYGLVYDLSLHGVCVRTEAPIKVGEQVSLILRLAKGTPPAEMAVATVCWTNHLFLGLAFRKISQSSCMQLTEYMNAEGMAKE